MSVTYTTAHSNARSLTHWARPGIEPVSSGILVGFISTEPQWELFQLIFSRCYNPRLKSVKGSAKRNKSPKHTLQDSRQDSFIDCIWGRQKEKGEEARVTPHRGFGTWVEGRVTSRDKAIPISDAEKTNKTGWQCFPYGLSYSSCGEPVGFKGRQVQPPDACSRHQEVAIRSFLTLQKRQNLPGSLWMRPGCGGVAHLAHRCSKNMSSSPSV